MEVRYRGLLVVLGLSATTVLSSEEQQFQTPSIFWPGIDATASNAAWLSGAQPENLASWSQTPATGTRRRTQSVLKSCWYSVALRRYPEWPGRCMGLTQHTGIDTMAGCQTSCKYNPECSSWQFNEDTKCWQGGGSECWHRQGHTDLKLTGAERIQHGAIFVLKNMNQTWVKGLSHIGLYYSNSSLEGISRCREWCYSNIKCQYWQFNSEGCNVEDPDAGYVSEFPLTTGSGYGAVLTTDTGADNPTRTMLAGEYIQHYCPLQPQPPVPVDPANVTPDETWPGEDSIISNHAWTGHVQPTAFSAWPRNSLTGAPLPCQNYTVLHSFPSWPGKCLGLSQKDSFNDVPVKDQEACMASCLQNMNCSVWQFNDDNKCWQGDGDSCWMRNDESWSVMLFGKSITVVGAQRLQHGEVRVLKNMDRIWLTGLRNLARQHDPDDVVGIQRCKAWCYSNNKCQYWQYNDNGCWVEDPYNGYKAPYPLTTGGSSPAAIDNPQYNDRGFTYKGEGASLKAGEYIQHLCGNPTLPPIVASSLPSTMVLALLALVAIVAGTGGVWWYRHRKATRAVEKTRGVKKTRAVKKTCAVKVSEAVPLMSKTEAASAPASFPAYAAAASPYPTVGLPQLAHRYSPMPMAMPAPAYGMGGCPPME